MTRSRIRCTFSAMRLRAALPTTLLLALLAPVLGACGDDAAPARADDAGATGVDEARGPDTPAAAAAEPGPPPDTGVVGHDRFIEVVIALREAERAVELRDSAAARFEVRRDSILDAYGVTGEDLTAYLRARGEDVDYLSALWDTINQRLMHVPPRHAPEDNPNRVPLDG